MVVFDITSIALQSIVFLFLTSPRQAGKKRLLWFCQKKEGVVLEPLQIE